MAGVDQDKESFFAYNLWLDQRGLGRVSFATYRAMFTSPAPAPVATPAPVAMPKPSKPEVQPVKAPEPKAPEPKRFHLICWLDDGGRKDDPINDKIKKATCVPFSYMSYHNLPTGGPERQQAWQAIEQALKDEPAAIVAIWGEGKDLPSHLGQAYAGKILRMPHPRDFSQPQMKAKFWQQLKSLMTKVAQHPSL